MQKLFSVHTGFRRSKRSNKIQKNPDFPHPLTLFFLFYPLNNMHCYKMVKIPPPS